MKKQITLFLAILLILSISFTNQQKKKGKGQEFDMLPEEYTKSYKEIISLMTQNPEQLEQLSTQYSIKVDERILIGLIRANIMDYKHAVEYAAKGGKRRFLDVQKEIKEEVKQDLESLRSTDPKEAKKHLDHTLKAMFNNGKYTNFEQIGKDKYIKEKNHGQVLDLEILIQQDQHTIKSASALIVQFFNHVHSAKSDDAKLESLDGAVDRVFTYYGDNRGISEEQMQEMFKRSNNLNNAVSWAQKYFSDPNFQKQLNDILNENKDSGEALSKLLNDQELFDKLFDGDMKDWDNISQQAHEIVNKSTIDTNQVDYLYDQFKEQQQQKKREEEMKAREEENKKHDNTVLIILGVLVATIALACLGRFLRKRKLERDSILRQQAYSQGI